MRVLPIDDATSNGEADLAAAYPRPAGRPWTRVAMPHSLDGGTAGADGRSRSISSDTVRGNAAVLPQGCVLVGLLEHESFLFARYLRSRPTHEDPA